MTKGKPICVYDYVNKPYQEVRDQLVANGTDIFRKATKTAASQIGSLASELHVNLVGFELSADITIKLNSVRESEKPIGRGRVTSMKLEWEAARLPLLFPLMKAELLVYPLTATETQLELTGNYEPPLGFVGSAMDSAAGNRIAEASIQHFITDVAVYLRDVAVYSKRNGDEKFRESSAENSALELSTDQGRNGQVHS
jgi:hypothetical protein